MCAALCSYCEQLAAAPLTEAHVTKIINNVKLFDPVAGARNAAINDIVRDQIELRTGIKSRSELQFTDNTLTRVGPETYFSFKAGTRDMTLERGTMLLQVPKGLGGATIHTAAVTASITGTTIMIEHRPGTDLKVLVLEGSLRLSVNGRFGDSVLLTPGRMIIMKPDAKRIPDPVAVDLAKLTKTSSLVNMTGGKKKAAPLPSLPLIEKAIAEQAKDKNSSQLINTNLVIHGSGTSVTLDGSTDLSNQAIAQLALLDTKANAAASPTATPAPTAFPSPSASPIPSPGATETPPGTPGPTPVSTPTPTPYRILFGQDGIVYRPVTVANAYISAGHDLTIAARVTSQLGTFQAGHDLNLDSSAYVQNLSLIAGHDLNYNGPILGPAANGTNFSAPGAGRSLTILASGLNLNDVQAGGGGDGGDDGEEDGNSSVAPITLSGGNAAFFSGFEGGNGGTLNIGTPSNPIPGNVNINSDVNASTGANGIQAATGGSGGNVNITTNGQATVSSSILVSDSASGRASKSGGNIRVTSNRTSGPAINVTSSAQLLALLSNSAPGPGGTIVFRSAGGNINMSGTAEADRGIVEFANTGAGGTVTLANATLRGDTVKAGALGSNGTLTIGGGIIDANTAIKLYAGGSNGQVNFINNVTLSGNSVKTIAADAVTIFNGKVVTVLGSSPANVFTNHPNYTGSGGNGSTSGRFAGRGATTQPLSNGPPGF